MDFGSMLSKLKRDAAEAAVTAAKSSSSTTATKTSAAGPSVVPPPAKRSRTGAEGEGAGRSRPDERQIEGGSSGADAAAVVLRPYPAETPVRTIYLACPPGVQTGGPEAMHQLCHALNNDSSSRRSSVGGGSGGSAVVRARMLYLREDGRSGGVGVRHARGARRVKAYDRYDAPPAKGMPGEGKEEEEAEGEGSDECCTSDLVIWPECWTHLIDSIDGGPAQRGGGSGDDARRRRRKASHQTAIWWLSVDNNCGRFRDWGRDDVLHLYQSEYARQYLRGRGARHVVGMTEYIPDRRRRTTTGEDDDGGGRDLQVLYNPLKGMHYTDEIRKRSGRGRDAIVFTPIGGGDDGRERLSPEEVASLLRRARIYIDFGPHPGMDRLPREAALAGCIVITNGEGAAQQSVL